MTTPKYLVLYSRFKDSLFKITRKLSPIFFWIGWKITKLDFSMLSDNLLAHNPGLENIFLFLAAKSKNKNFLFQSIIRLPAYVDFSSSKMLLDFLNNQ